jgi:Fe-S-cluster containining protein
LLFDHCAECRRCCNVDAGHPPLEITLTTSEKKSLGSVCIEGDCEHLGSTGCVIGKTKPFSCQLYPLAYNPKNRNFYFDTECPLMPQYVKQLKDSASEASRHLAAMSKTIVKLEKSDPTFLQDNYEVDSDYFDLKRLTHKPLPQDNSK